MHRLAAAALVAAGLGACSQPGADPARPEQAEALSVPTRPTGSPNPPPSAPGPIARVHLSVSEAPGGPAAGSFRLAATRDLYLAADWTGLSGSHAMTVVVRSPAGDVYEREVVPMSDSLLGPESVMLPRAVHPLTVQRVAPWRPLHGTARLALAGTPIQQQGVTGDWTFEVHLDDAPSPAASLKVVLQ